MAYSYNSPNYFKSELEAEWSSPDPSQFLWDSPQPESQALPSATDNAYGGGLIQGDAQNLWSNNSEPSKVPASGSSNPQSQLQRSAVQAHFPGRSSTSETSSHSSSSGSSAKRKRKVSPNSPPPMPLAGQNVIDDGTPSSDFSMNRFLEGGGGDNEYKFDDSLYPSMGQDMNNLSLNNIGTMDTFGFNSTGASSDPMNTPQYSGNFTPLQNSQGARASPQMTVQPSKTFFLGGGDDSPNSMTMMNSQESSPEAIFAGNSPLPGNNSNAMAQTMAVNGSLSDGQAFDPNALTFGLGSMSRSIGMSPPNNNLDQQPYAAWPCRLEVAPTPEKSRVETQIPIKLTLSNAPPGIHRLHLPSHTISKPKFQSKPPFETSDDTLELSAMLVCASAMETPEVEKSAFRRAASDDIYVESEENKPANSKIQGDDNDPNKPLNGGPVAICAGCIVRERKRAARKKTKKADEEEEWAKDEAKRVIVFNCPEVRDWCVPDSKETPAREHDGSLDTIVVQAPMRIACYCRHQSEKIGFQVIFTLRMANGTIVAQAISQSIMITDDHKQPSSGQHSSMGSNEQSQVGGTGYYQGGQNDGMQSYHQPLPFRTSFSTNDLSMLRNQNVYSSLRQPQNFSRDNSGLSKMQNAGASTGTSTATATPRNLSRPASPTGQTGPTTKKRRSGGIGHNRVPSGLTMTRLGDMNSASAGGLKSGPTSAGPMSTGFSFTPNLGTGQFSPSIDSYKSPGGVQNPFRSGPPTPLHNPNMPNFGNNMENDLYFYSAPTSQHGSRAPSPAGGSRGTGTSFPASLQQSEQAADLLSRLPVGINLNRPPIIQRVIPNIGPQQGGDEVTILGTGFFQGLKLLFGENEGVEQVLWGDTTLVCRAPPGKVPGMVQVMFQHQYELSGSQQLRGLLPTAPVYYEYFDNDKDSMEMLAVDIGSQGQSNNLGQMSPDSISAAFLNTTGGFSDFTDSGGSGQYQQRSGSPYDVAKICDADFESLLMKWLDFMDVDGTPYQPSYNKRDRRGATLLLLAAGRGYLRFCAGLLARGADPNPRDRGGYTPLMMASMRNHLDILNLLSVRGADPTLRTLTGYTAEDFAVSREAVGIFGGMSGSSIIKLGTVRKDFSRRPSSILSIDSLSGLSTSSQLSKFSSSDDSEHPFQSRRGSDIAFQIPWDTRDRQLSAGSRDDQAYTKALAALSAWREPMIAQLYHLQQALCALPHKRLPTFPPMPSLPSLPQKINSLDYQQYYNQYPMVRRISDFLSPMPSSQHSDLDSVQPPAYEDIFPKISPAESSPEVTSTKSEEKRGSIFATVEPFGDRKCTEALDGTSAIACKAKAAGNFESRNASTDEASIFRAMNWSTRHGAEAGSLYPWVLVLLALVLAAWNYVAPDTCPSSTPLTRFKGLLEWTDVARVPA